MKKFSLTKSFVSRSDFVKKYQDELKPWVVNDKQNKYFPFNMQLYFYGNKEIYDAIDNTILSNKEKSLIFDSYIPFVNLPLKEFITVGLEFIKEKENSSKTRHNSFSSGPITQRVIDDYISKNSDYVYLSLSSDIVKYDGIDFKGVFYFYLFNEFLERAAPEQTLDNFAISIESELDQFLLDMKVNSYSHTNKLESLVKTRNIGVLNSTSPAGVRNYFLTLKKKDILHSFTNSNVSFYGSSQKSLIKVQKYFEDFNGSLKADQVLSTRELTGHLSFFVVNALSKARKYDSEALFELNKSLNQLVEEISKRVEKREISEIILFALENQDAFTLQESLGILYNLARKGGIPFNGTVVDFNISVAKRIKEDFGVKFLAFTGRLTMTNGVIRPDLSEIISSEEELFDLPLEISVSLMVKEKRNRLHSSSSGLVSLMSKVI